MNLDKQTIDFYYSEIERHNYLYYVKGEPEITDEEYDKLLKVLIDYESNSTELLTKDLITEHIGNDITNKFSKSLHKRPMKSISNTYNKEDLIEFDRKIKETLGIDTIEYITELKIDGIALSLIYEDGKLVRGVTRGNGLQGEDITNNIKMISSIPHTLNVINPPKELEVRGEVYLDFNTFDKINEARKLNNEELFKHPRNAVVGTLKQYDSNIVLERNLSFTAYQLFIDNYTIQTDIEALNILKSYGFNVDIDNIICKDINEVINYIDRFQTLRFILNEPTDGIVIKVNNLKYRDEIGETHKTPNWATAYKYQSEEVKTQLLNIIYQVGRTGLISPVAEFNPIMISGSLVKRASLNISDIKDNKGLYKYDCITVIKSGEIIPKIIAIDYDKRNYNLERFKLPTNCPSCNTDLVINDDDIQLYCTNKLSCEPQIIGRILHFADNKALNIKGLGIEIITKLVQLDLIKSFIDLYKLTYNDLIKINGLKDKSINNLLYSIETTKNSSLDRIIYGLGIPNVGSHVSKILVNTFNNMINIENATLEELKNIHEIGEITAENIYNYIHNNKKLMQELRDLGFNLDNNANSIQGDKLKNLKFVITGSFDNYNRQELAELISLNGGVTTNSISKNTNFLIQGNKPTQSKIDKALKLNVNSININDLLNMLK